LANPVENLLECTQQPTSLTADPAVSPTGWGAISLTDTVLFPRQVCYPARWSPSGVGQRMAWHSGELPLLARRRIVPRGEPVPQFRVRAPFAAPVARRSVARAEPWHPPCQTTGRAPCPDQQQPGQHRKPPTGNDGHRRRAVPQIDVDHTDS